MSQECKTTSERAKKLLEDMKNCPIDRSMDEHLSSNMTIDEIEEAALNAGNNAGIISRIGRIGFGLQNIHICLKSKT